MGIVSNIVNTVKNIGTPKTVVTSTPIPAKSLGSTPQTTSSNNIPKILQQPKDPLSKFRTTQASAPISSGGSSSSRNNYYNSNTGVYTDSSGQQYSMQQAPEDAQLVGGGQATYTYSPTQAELQSRGLTPVTTAPTAVYNPDLGGVMTSTGKFYPTPTTQEWIPAGYVQGVGYTGQGGYYTNQPDVIGFEDSNTGMSYSTENLPTIVQQYRPQDTQNFVNLGLLKETGQQVLQPQGNILQVTIPEQKPTFMEQQRAYALSGFQYSATASANIVREGSSTGVTSASNFLTSKIPWLNKPYDVSVDQFGDEVIFRRLTPQQSQQLRLSAKNDLGWSFKQDLEKTSLTKKTTLGKQFSEEFGFMTPAVAEILLFSYGATRGTGLLKMGLGGFSVISGLEQYTTPKGKENLQASAKVLSKGVYALPALQIVGGAYLLGKGFSATRLEALQRAKPHTLSQPVETRSMIDGKEYIKTVLKPEYSVSKIPAPGFRYNVDRFPFIDERMYTLPSREFKLGSLDITRSKINLAGTSLPKVDNFKLPSYKLGRYGSTVSDTVKTFYPEMRLTPTADGGYIFSGPARTTAKIADWTGGFKSIVSKPYEVFGIADVSGPAVYVPKVRTYNMQRLNVNLQRSPVNFAGTNIQKVNIKIPKSLKLIGSPTELKGYTSEIILPERAKFAGVYREMNGDFTQVAGDFYKQSSVIDNKVRVQPRNIGVVLPTKYIDTVESPGFKYLKQIFPSDKRGVVGMNPLSFRTSVKPVTDTNFYILPNQRSVLDKIRLDNTGLGNTIGSSIGELGKTRIKITNLPIVSFPLLKPSTRQTLISASVLKPVYASKNILIQKPLVNERYVSKLVVIETPVSISKSRSGSGITQSLISVPKQVQTTKQVLEQVQTPAQITKQFLAPKQSQAPREITIKTPTIITPKLDDNKRPRPLNTFARKVSQDKFIVEFRRRGTFFPLAETKSLPPAIIIGKSAARKTLGASFRIKSPSGKYVPLAPSQEFRLGKGTGILVQRARTRLSSRDERVEIAGSRRAKGYTVYPKAKVVLGLPMVSKNANIKLIKPRLKLFGAKPK